MSRDWAVRPVPSHATEPDDGPAGRRPSGIRARSAKAEAQAPADSYGTARSASPSAYSPGAGADFAATPIRPTLALGSPADRSERSADDAAAQVAAGADARQVGAARAGTGTQQAPASVECVLNEPGEPLDATLRRRMEPRFGFDFADVRVHAGDHAERSAAEMGAAAYTVGRHIAVGSGRSTTDVGLIAHELAHVVQQSAGGPMVQRLIRSPYPWLGVITPASGANIRSSTSTKDKSNVVGAAPHGHTVTVTGVKGDWLEVETTLNGLKLTGFIHNSLVDDAASSEMASEVGTTMVWKPSGPGSGTDFEKWAAAAKETPFTVTAKTVMNCWEAVLLSAYRSGALKWTWIHDLYTKTPMADWVKTMSRGPLKGYSVPGPNADAPQRGDIVFFDGLAHIALATGDNSAGAKVFTFWPPPNTPFVKGGTPDKVKIYTIEELYKWWETNLPPAPTVQFGAPAW